MPFPVLPQTLPVPAQRPLMQSGQPVAPRPMMAPQATQGGFMNGLRNNSDALLQLGVGLLSGQTGPQQMALGFSGFTNARKAAKDKNKTLAWMRANAPEYADAVDAGALSLQDAYKLKLADQKGGARQELINAGGGQLYDPNSGRWITAPNTGQPDLPSAAQEYEYAKRQGFPGSFMDYQNAKKGQGFSVTTPDGTVVQMGGNAKPMTESQAKANIYATRAEQSNAILGRLETQGTGLMNKMASGVPVAGNYMIDEQYRQYEQAKRDFVNAILRNESGAVISPSEFKNAEVQYFPQPGDDPTTIEQKRQNRETAIRGIREASNRPASGAAMPGPQGGNVTSGGIQWSVEP